MERKVVWTEPAKNDLKSIYNFLSKPINEKKTFEIIERIVGIGRILAKRTIAGAKYQSKISPSKDY